MDAAGELLVRGKGVFGGYYRGVPSDVLTSDGYYKTGDFAYFDDAGFLTLAGRKSEIVKTSTGRRVSPTAIEQKREQVAYGDRAVVLGNGRKLPLRDLVARSG